MGIGSRGRKKWAGRRGSGVLPRIGVLVAVAVGSAWAPGLVAQASAANFTPTHGLYQVDTSTLSLTGSSTDVTGVVKHGVAVFSFGKINIGSHVVISVTGSRPFELKASKAFVLAGVIDGSGINAVEGNSNNEEPYLGGPGGRKGGATYPDSGSGAGGGGAPTNSESGGGGGGFGGAGAAGGLDGGTRGAGGGTYGNLKVALRGGSGGGASSDVGGGGGGGAIELSASSLQIKPSGAVLANGGDGSGGGDGASGGGSGGAILLHAATLDVAGMLQAIGGAGGTGGCCGDGGGGGGGRIAYQYKKLMNAGTALVLGGASGTSGTYSHGELSPKPFGGRGVITRQKLSSAQNLGSATSSRSRSGPRPPG